MSSVGGSIVKNMIINRKRNAITGTATGLFLKIVTMVGPFITRTIFIRTLGAEYLGLNGLFSSVLQVLNLAELGVGSALVYSMYEPIASNNNVKMCALMCLYRRYYRIIGTIVLMLGLLLAPFLRYLIKGAAPEDINIYIIFLMQLCSTVLSYWLFSYRNSLFQAHQRTDITNIISIFINIFIYIFQTIILIWLKNYYLYLTVTIFFQIISNLVTAVLSKKFYPEYYPNGSLDKSEVKKINTKIASLFTAKFATVIHRSFDTLIISSFLGLSVLAIYQNYFYIESSLSSFVRIIFLSMQAGVGNYLITKNDNEIKALLYNINHLTMFVICVSCCCMLNLYQPFMKLWMGDQYLLPFPMVLLFTGSFAVDILLRPLLMFKDSGGMWNEDRLRPLAAALCNLFLNLLTVRKYGLYGVIGSTIISFMLVALPWLIFNINKYQFNLGVRKYVLSILIYSFVIVLICFATYYLCTIIKINSEVLTLLVRLFISIVVSGCMFIVVFHNKPEHKYFKHTILNMVKKHD